MIEFGLFEAMLAMIDHTNIMGGEYQQRAELALAVINNAIVDSD